MLFLHGVQPVIQGKTTSPGRLGNIAQCYFFECQIHKLHTVTGTTKEANGKLN